MTKSQFLVFSLLPDVREQPVLTAKQQQQLFGEEIQMVNQSAMHVDSTTNYIM